MATSRRGGKKLKLDAVSELSRTAEPLCVTGGYSRRRIYGWGFRIQERLDFLPFYAMWRVYVLRKG
jgi:hypothetical protein